MSKILLFDSKVNCCSCGSCMNICPKKAITMEQDEYGFLYPKIDSNKCINCKLCLKACPYKQSEEGNSPINVYAAATKNTDIFRSASGGIFASLAKSIILEGGVVFGAALLFEENQLVPKHISINTLSDLYKIQGSKYVQSNIGLTYKEAKELLDNGKLVLFSGTPCQISGLKSFLKKDYKNLLLIDIICHGVPSSKFFNDYIDFEEKRVSGKINEFKFREKSYGWKLRGKANYITTSGKKSVLRIYPGTSSYYNFFLNADIYRENCYECKYAKNLRISDITIGDYWGIANEHPELLKNKSESYSLEKGISCILVNNKKGEYYIDKYKSGLYLYKSEFNKVSKNNSQLSIASKKSNNRLDILNIYKCKGYSGVDKYFIKKQGIKYYIKKLYYMFPDKIQKRMEKIRYN